MADPATKIPATEIAVPIGPRATAYLYALQREDISIVDIPTLLLVVDSVCARQSDTTVPAQADRLLAAFPGRWRPQQAAVIVDSAIKFVCDDTTQRGAIVSADIHPVK